jgi:ABC-type multidrug transport system fused ATPase/permease subunit
MKLVPFVRDLYGQSAKMCSIAKRMGVAIWSRRAQPDRDEQRLSRERRQMLIRILLVPTLALLPYVRAHSFGALIDWANANQALALAVLPLVGLIGAWVVFNLLDNVRMYANRSLNSSLERYFAQRSAEKREMVGMRGFDTKEVRDLLQNAENGEWRSRDFFGAFLDLLAEIAGVVSASVIAFAYLPPMAAVLVLAAVVCLAMQVRQASEQERVDRECFELSRRSDWLRNIFRRDQNDLRTIMLVGMGRRIRRLIGMRVEEVEDKKIALAGDFLRRNAWAELALGLGLGSAILYLVWQVHSGAISVGKLSFLLVSLITFAGSLGWVADAFGRLAEKAHSIYDLFELHDKTIPSLPEPKAPADVSYNVPQEIRLDGVTFSYPGETEPVFDGLDITFPKGEMTWLLGANGVGKSTIYSLVARLYDPQQGAVLIGGKDVRHLRTEQLRHTVRIVTQTAFKPLLPIDESLRLGSHLDEVSEEQLWAALEFVCFKSRVERFPDGIKQDLGPWIKGRPAISGGEWRKLHIAMLIISALQGCGVLVLDEPTAEVDPPSSRTIIDNLRKLANTTRIISTHQMDLIRPTDFVVFLELVSRSPRTVVAHRGTFEQLVRECPAFATYCAITPPSEAAKV